MLSAVFEAGGRAGFPALDLWHCGVNPSCVTVLHVPFSPFILRIFVEKVNSLTTKRDHPPRENSYAALNLTKQQPNFTRGFLPWAFGPPRFSCGLCRVSSSQVVGSFSVLVDMVGLVVGDYHHISGISEVFAAFTNSYLCVCCGCMCDFNLNTL